MTYESRIYLINVQKNNKTGEIYCIEQIAIFDIGMLGYSSSWKELSHNNVDYKIDSGNENVYGKHLKSVDFEKVLNWLEEMQQKINYCRIAPLLGMLKGFNKTEWDELQIVHYGY